jgi:hypothetical protein
MLFENDIYPKNEIDTSGLPIQSLFEVTTELAYNPVKVALKAMKGLENADLLWSANQILNPYEDLKPGLILKVPFTSLANDKLIKKPKNNKSIKLKHVSKDGNKLYY